MKKILFVANVAKEHILKFHIPTIKTFKENGWVVDVACSGEEEIPFVDTQYKTSWKRNPFTLKTFKGIKELKKIINENGYDVVYCHTPVGGLVARIAAKKARKKGTKIVYCAHGLHFYKGAPILNWLLYYPVEKWLSHYTDLMLLINQEDYQTINSKFSKKLKTKLIPGIGIDFNRLSGEFTCEDRLNCRKQLGIPEDAKILIYVAELIENKNQEMLINALKQIRESEIDAYLLLVGPDHRDGYYQAYANKLGLEQYVKFTGWRSDVGNLLKSSDICVASSKREGFGLNIVEAMYCNLPVIASRNRGHASIINDGENGYLVEINDSELMAKKVISLINSDEERNKFINLSVKQYDAKAVAENLFNVISKL